MRNTNLTLWRCRGRGLKMVTEWATSDVSIQPDWSTGIGNPRVRTDLHFRRRPQRVEQLPHAQNTSLVFLTKVRNISSDRFAPHEAARDCQATTLSGASRALTIQQYTTREGAHHNDALHGKCRTLPASSIANLETPTAKTVVCARVSHEQFRPRAT